MAQKQEKTKSSRKLLSKETKQAIVDILGSSMLTGVQEIVNAGSPIRRGIKSIIFVACLSGFIYQAVEFMDMYWKYPTVIDVQIKHPEFIDMPAITICNNNGMNRTYLCELAKPMCNTPPEAWRYCEKHPMSCMKLNSPDQLRMPLARWDAGEKIIILDSIGDILSSHQFFSMVNITWAPALLREIWQDEKLLMEHVYRKKSLDTNWRRVMCYTLFGTNAQNKTEPYKLKLSSGQGEDKSEYVKLFSADLNFEAWDYYQIDRTVGARIAIHSPTVLVNAMTVGSEILGQHSATVQVSMTEYNLLPSPYETNCFDYKADWEKNGGPRPLSQEMCLEECSIRGINEMCGCVPLEFRYPNNFVTCAQTSEVTCARKSSVQVEQGCRKTCEKPCRYVVYDSSINQRIIDINKVDYMENDTDILMMKTTGKIDIYMKRPEIVVYNFKPKFESVETFSYVGGYVGMWLGISLIAVFDFVESLVLLSKYCCERKEKSTKVAVKPFQN